MKPQGATGGLFVALEGIDGSGTTTQARLLVERIEAAGRAAHLTREPSDGPVGKLLRQVLGARYEMPPATTALLFAADRVHHFSHEIAPRLAAGAAVVSDRYLLSSLAYQSVGSELSWIESINAHATLPDVTILLRVDATAAAARRAVRGGFEEIFENDAFQERVARRYDELVDQEMVEGFWTQREGAWERLAGGAGSASVGEVAVLDGVGDVSAIHEAIFDLVRSLSHEAPEEV